MSPERSNQYAAELPLLFQRGIRYVSLTGGEPFLAPRQVKTISAAASVAGMTCTIVTACHWAPNSGAAERWIRRFPGIHKWHCSTDVFHTEFLPAANVVHAASAAIRLGRDARIRMCVSRPITAEQNALHAELRDSLGQTVPIDVQPLTPSGRGAGLVSETEGGGPPGQPCIPGGPLIHWDGTVSPCCSNLAFARELDPFGFPNADEGLTAVREAWLANPLLLLMRTAGFIPLLDWLAEDCPEHAALRNTPRSACECCLAIWKDPKAAALLRRRSERPLNRAKIAALAEVLFEPRQESLTE